MTLTILIDAAARTARLKEVDALSAGDLYDPLVLDGVPGADPATLSAVLYRDATMSMPVAASGAFSAVQGHARLAEGTLAMDSVEMGEWMIAATGLDSSDDESAGEAADRAEKAVRADGWLVVADASRTWAACRVPVVLRDIVGRGSLSGSTVGELASAAALAAVDAALAGKADLVGGVVPLSQLPSSPVEFAASRAAFPARGADGKLYVDESTGRVYRWTGAAYAELAPGRVTSVNGESGDVSVDADFPEQVQADWEESDSAAASYIANKPDLSGARADWDEADASSPSYIANKPDLGALARSAQADWTEESEGSPAYVRHRPTPREMQADWNESDDSKASFVRNRPTAAQLQADWAETDPSSPKFVGHKPDGTAWQADWLEESMGSPNYVRNRPTAYDRQADWEESDSSKASFVRRKPTAYDRQADWEESDSSKPSYVRNRPSAAARQADWAETDTAKASYIRNKPPAGATLAEVEAAVAAAVAGKQDRLGAVSLGVLESGITADKVRYFERLAAFALGGSAAGYPFAEISPSKAVAGWTFAGSVPVGSSYTQCALPGPVLGEDGWEPLPYEKALGESGWEPEAVSSDDSSLVLAFPQARTVSDLMTKVTDISWLQEPQGRTVGSATLTYTPSGTQAPALVETRTLGDGTAVYYLRRPASHYGQANGLFSIEFRSPAELDAASGKRIPMFLAPEDSTDGYAPVFSPASSPAGTLYAEAELGTVVPVPTWTVAATGSVPSAPIVPGALPDGVSGVQRDMFLVVDAGSTDGSGELSWDAAFDVFDGDVTLNPSGLTAYRLTEYSPGRFSVRKAGGTVQADWDESDGGKASFVRNKPAPRDLQADWDESDSGAASFVRNRPDVAGMMMDARADWSESDSADPSFVLNRPDVVTKPFLLSGGKVKAELLPSYVDDVLEYSDSGDFPPQGEPGKIYVVADDGRVFRWSGSTYVRVSSPHVPADPVAVYSDMLGPGDPGYGDVAGAAETGEHLVALRDGKLDGAAAYPAWNDQYSYSAGDVVTYFGQVYRALVQSVGVAPVSDPDTWSNVPIGSLIASKADKVSGATAGNLASLTATGNLADSGVKPSDFAARTDLPYALVTPGEWEFSGSGYDSTNHEYRVAEAEDEGIYTYELYIDDEWVEDATEQTSTPATTVEFAESSITATRASLPGHLLDRAVNAVPVSTDTTLTLPALVNAGKARDFLVRLTVSGSTVPTITFAAPTGETIAYETDGDEFPVPDEAGTWLYSFTETVAGTFAVALKSVSVVTQGGV